MTGTFKGWHMAVITVSFFAVIIAVNITLAVFANRSWTGLVVENSYVASQNFNRDAEIARQQHAVGWQMKLDMSKGPAEVSILDRAGKPLLGLAVHALLQHPVSDSQDQQLMLREIQPGIYASAGTLASGSWIVDVTAEGDDHKPVRFVERIVVK
jgi:nitrogen fixation protein FixH